MKTSSWTWRSMLLLPGSSRNEKLIVDCVFLSIVYSQLPAIILYTVSVSVVCLVLNVYWSTYADVKRTCCFDWVVSSLYVLIHCFLYANFVLATGWRYTCCTMFVLYAEQSSTDNLERHGLHTTTSNILLKFVSFSCIFYAFITTDQRSTFAKK